MKRISEKIISVAGGLVIGLVNGFFGSGGGMLLVPLLEKGLKEETKTAHATAILIILPISAASLVVYLLNGFIGLSAMLSCGAGVLAGGIAGACLLKLLPPKIIGFLFAAAMIGIGIKLAVS